MKTFIIALLAVAGIAVAACAQQKQTMNQKQSDRKILVAYFSATGTTAKAARQIADETGGELHEIVPAEAYTAADLDWNNKQSRSSIEMNDPKSRPAIKADNKRFIADCPFFARTPAAHDLNPNTPPPPRQAPANRATACIPQTARRRPNGATCAEST